MRVLIKPLFYLVFVERAWLFLLHKAVSCLLSGSSWLLGRLFFFCLYWCTKTFYGGQYLFMRERAERQHSQNICPSLLWKLLLNDLIRQIGQGLGIRGAWCEKRPWLAWCWPQAAVTQSQWVTCQGRDTLGDCRWPQTGQGRRESWSGGGKAAGSTVKWQKETHAHTTPTFCATTHLTGGIRDGLNVTKAKNRATWD